jgi:hypothetical protein
MRRFHQIFGLLIILVFLLTGQYMDVYRNHMVGVEDGPRMLYRTRHIFILLTGLLHLPARDVAQDSTARGLSYDYSRILSLHHRLLL